MILDRFRRKPEEEVAEVPKGEYTGIVSLEAGLGNEAIRAKFENKTLEQLTVELKKVGEQYESITDRYIDELKVGIVQKLLTDGDQNRLLEYIKEHSVGPDSHGLPLAASEMVIFLEKTEDRLAAIQHIVANSRDDVQLEIIMFRASSLLKKDQLKQVLEQASSHESEKVRQYAIKLAKKNL